MIQGLFRTYKKIIVIVLIVMSALIFWFATHRKDEREVVDTSKWERVEKDKEGRYYRFENEYLTGTLSFGTQGTVSADKTLPVVLTAECKEKQFDGIMQINLPGEYGKGISYQAALRCKKGIRTRLVLEVPQLGNASGFVFKIQDQFENNLFSKTISLEKKEAREISIGLLSSNNASYSYLDGVTFQVGETDCVSHLVELSPDFLGDVRQLRALSIILIDSFHTKNLSDLQREAIYTWVDEGGILLLGGGSQSPHILSAFEEEYGMRAGEINQRRIQIQDGENDLGVLAVTYAEILLENETSWKSLEGAEPVAVYTKNVEDGKVSVLTFSMADNAWIQWISRDEAMRKMASELLSDSLKEKKGIELANWYLQKALYAFEDSQSPNIFYYGLFFLIYLFCLGIISYDILKEIKRREYIWYVIPVLALIFTALVGVRAINNSSEPDSFLGGIQIQDREKRQKECYLFYQSKDGKRKSLKLNPAYQYVEPMDYVYSENISNQQSTPVDYIVNDTKNGKEVDISESVPGVSQLIKITANEKQVQTTQSGNFKVKITGDDKRFRGTIENVSGRNYERVLLIRGTQYTVLSDVKKNSENKIMGSDVSLWNELTSKETGEQNTQSRELLDNLLIYLEQRYILKDNKLNQLIVIGITEDETAELFTDKTELKKYLSVEVNRYKILKDQYQEKR